MLLFGGGCIRQQALAPQSPQDQPTMEKQSDWKTYSNTPEKFEISYPADFVMATDKSRVDPTAIFEAHFPSTYVTGTNLRDAYVAVRVIPGACSMPNWFQKQTPVTKNGITFQVSTGGEGAAGSREVELQYATEYGGKWCYQVALVENYTSRDMYRDADGNFPPGTPAEFDAEKIQGVFEQVVGTFTFTD